MRVVIIGGVAGGASCAARLRRNDEKVEIVMLERGGYVSFAKCGLPYYLGGVIEDREELLLQTPESLKSRFNIDARIHSEVTAIDRENKKVNVRDIAGDTHYALDYDKLVISTGTATVVPPIPGLESMSEGVFELRSIEDTFAIDDYIKEHNVKHAVLAGAGFTGIELAENLVLKDIGVTVIDRAEQVLLPFDRDMVPLIQNTLRAKGVRLILGAEIKGVKRGAKIGVELGTGKEIECELLVVSLGVKPETALAKGCGLECRKGIVVNSKMQTSDENIYAVGDCVESLNLITNQWMPMPMAGPANKQGRLAADVICAKERTYKGSVSTCVIKVFELTCAACGANEAALKAAGIEFKKIIIHPFSHASYYPGAAFMQMKLLFGEDGRVLGAQCVGKEGVEKRIDVIATAIQAGMNVYELSELELCYAPPYSSAKDPVNMAGFVAGNVLDGLESYVYFEDLEQIKKAYTLLDVRSDEEFANGSLAGSINIPVDELRARYTELKEPVAIYCQSGIRAHTASRMLTQCGIENVIIAGSWLHFRQVLKNKNSH